jgi:hypothetical protein
MKIELEPKDIEIIKKRWIKKWEDAINSFEIKMGETYTIDLDVRVEADWLK